MVDMEALEGLLEPGPWEPLWVTLEMQIREAVDM